MEEELKLEGMYRTQWKVEYGDVVMDTDDGERVRFYKEELLPLAAFLIAAYNQLNKVST